jgi:alcohol dehydrogenase
MTKIDLTKLNVFYVTGKKSFELSGAKDYIINSFSKEGKINQFNDFSANPKFEDVKKGIRFFRKGNYNCIVAVGGGSVIDMGKLISFYLEKGTDSFSTTVDDTFSASCPIVAIPTTAGSGSEETHFAVVYNLGVKYSVAHSSIKPIDTIINPNFSFSCPPQQKLFSALDAFCQSIESYWSKGATNQSKEYSSKAITLLKENLEKGLIQTDFESFKNIVIGSNYAGKAINISKTTACHALSYYFTSNFNIPHGQSVAMLMPYVFDYHYKKMIDSDIMTELVILLDFKSTNFYYEFGKYFKELGLVTDFKTLGIDLQINLDNIVQNVNQERLDNNPIKINIYKLFKK